MKNRSPKTKYAKNVEINKQNKKSLKLLKVLLVLLIALGVTVIAKALVDNDYFGIIESVTTSEPNQEVTAEPTAESTVEPVVTTEPTINPTVEPTAEPTSEPTTEPTEEPVEIPWNLILVNYENPLPDDYIFVQKSYSSKVVDERIYDELSAMMNAAKSEGYSLWIASAYRSVSKQETILQNAITNRMNSYGWTRDEATANALLTIAVPGYSEHHTGLAVDFNNVNSAFQYTEVYQWLQENAADYGFILRYPDDKTDITNINYEPWHYRYVGVEAAQIISSEGLCLEEYLELYY